MLTSASRLQCLASQTFWFIYSSRPKWKLINVPSERRLDSCVAVWSCLKMLSSLDFKESHSLIPPSNLNLIDLKSPQVRCGRETTREAADAEGRAHKYARMHAHVFEYLTGAYWCRSLAAVQCALNTTDSTQHIKQNTASPIDPWEFIKTLFSNAVWCLSFLEWEAAGNLIKLMDKKNIKGCEISIGVHVSASNQPSAEWTK